MEVIIQPTYAQLVRVFSRNYPRRARKKAESRFWGLATGSTPIGLYEALARMHKTEGLDFSSVTTF